MALVVEDIVAQVRFLLGDPSETLISTELITSICESSISKLGDDDSMYCKVLQDTLMNTLRYLVRKSQIPASAGASSGSTLKRRKEKRGNTEIEVEYEESSSDDTSSSGWSGMYEDYEEHPEWICEELVPTGAGKYLVSIGGVQNPQVHSVKRDPISHTVYDRRRINNKFRNKHCRKRRR